MTITFTTKSGKTLTGTVIARGHTEVDGAEVYTVQVPSIDHATFQVPVQ